MNDGKRQILEALSMAGNFGIIMVVNAAVGLLIGKGIDKLLDSSPFGVAIGAALGMIAGFRSIYRRVAALDDGDGNAKKNARNS